MVAGRQVGVFLKMFWTQRLGNGVLAAQPFAEVNQLAAVRAKRAVFAGKSMARLPAGGAFHLDARGRHSFTAITAHRAALPSQPL